MHLRKLSGQACPRFATCCFCPRRARPDSNDLSTRVGCDLSRGSCIYCDVHVYVRVYVRARVRVYVRARVRAYICVGVTLATG